MTLAIEQLCKDMKEYEAECQMIEAVYNDLVVEIKARIDQRIQEVKDGV